MHQRLIRIALLILLLPLSAHAHEQLINVSHRKTVSLNGDWHYIVDPYETGYYNYRRQAYDLFDANSTSAFYNNYHPKDKTELVEYDFDQSPTMTVPGDWNSQKDTLLYYEGTVWLRRMFDFKGSHSDHHVFIHFGAVNYKAEVYLNGTKLGIHEGGFTPFNFEVTSLIKPKDNFLVVKVDNVRRPDAVPTTSTDWWNYGGITRDVSLIEEPKYFIQDYRIQLKQGSGTHITGFVKLTHASAHERVTVRIPELYIQQVFQLDDAGQVNFEFETRDIKHWSPDAPKLYEVIIETALQSLSDSIGFRTIEARGKEILLNGKPIFLRGISIHEENTLTASRAHSEADALLALNWAKELGCNYVRLAHYPHNEYMVSSADKMGIMIWEEIPVYWTIDFSNLATLAKAKQQLSEVITRDNNRASVIIWSVANETPPSDKRNEFLSNLIQHTKAHDGTRLISAALETHSENGISVVDDSIGEQLDIVAFNQYRGWYGGTLHDAPEAKWEVRFNKPVVISEFGGDALQGLHGLKEDRWTEEYQAYLYLQNLAMLEKIPNLRGLSPWILADFRSPRRVLPKIQDGYNRKGLISNQGVKKQAFFTLQEFYKKIAAQYRRAD